MSIFSGIPVATLNAWLSDAQAAMQKLATGSQVASVATSDGKSVRFTPAELPKLKGYIGQLQAAIAEATGDTSASRPYSIATWTR